MATTTGAGFGGLTQQDKDWHAVYEGANAIQRADIAAAVNTTVQVLRERGYTCATDDRIEKLMSAVTRYVTESQQ